MTSTPRSSLYDRADALYSDGELDEVVLACARYGTIHLDDECFFCAIETKSKKELDTPDTWMICIASGDIKVAFRHIKPMKYIAYERFDGKFRIFGWEKFRRLAWAVK